MVDQTGFFMAGDDFDGVGQSLFDSGDKIGAVDCNSQRVGGYQSDLGVTDIGKSEVEVLQALHSPIDGLFTQVVIVIQSLS